MPPRVYADGASRRVRSSSTSASGSREGQVRLTPSLVIVAMPEPKAITEFAVWSTTSPRCRRSRCSWRWQACLVTSQSLPEPSATTARPGARRRRTWSTSAKSDSIRPSWSPSSSTSTSNPAAATSSATRGLRLAPSRVNGRRSWVIRTVATRSAAAPPGWPAGHEARPARPRRGAGSARPARGLPSRPRCAAGRPCPPGPGASARRRPLAPVTRVDLLDLVDVAGRGAAFELRGQPVVEDLLGRLGGDHPGPHGQDLGVAGLAGPFGRVGVVGGDGPDPGDLVGGDGHAQAGAADQQGAVVLAPGHGLGDLGGDVGIVEPVAVAVVPDLVALLAQVGGQVLLQRGAGLVGADRDRSHDRPVSRRGGRGRGRGPPGGAPAPRPGGVRGCAGRRSGCARARARRAGAPRCRRAAGSGSRAGARDGGRWARAGGLPLPAPPWPRRRSGGGVQGPP